MKRTVGVLPPALVLSGLAATVAYSRARTPNGNDYGKDLLAQHPAAQPH